MTAPQEPQQPAPQPQQPAPQPAPQPQQPAPQPQQPAPQPTPQPYQPAPQSPGGFDPTALVNEVRAIPERVANAVRESSHQAQPQPTPTPAQQTEGTPSPGGAPKPPADGSTRGKFHKWWWGE